MLTKEKLKELFENQEFQEELRKAETKEQHTATLEKWGIDTGEVGKIIEEANKCTTDEEMLEVFRKYGIEFDSLEECLQYIKPSQGEAELNDQELENVQGGLMIGFCVAYGFGMGECCAGKGLTFACLLIGFP